LLDELRESAGAAPRLGKAAAELCRLAFALGRADDVADAARLALESAVGAAAAARGVVLLPDQPGDALDAPGGMGGATRLATAAALPTDAAAFRPPPGLVAAVLDADEAVLAGPAAAAGAAGITVPVRVRGRPLGVLHVELPGDGREAGADDLELVMAVGDALGLAIESCVTRERLSTRLTRSAEENERLRRLVGEESLLAGSSPGMRALVGVVGRAAATKATVLVRGESGVGKELVARSLHEASGRRGGPFVCLNCAALSETLLESELFGHEKGAFTGAAERKAGRFEAADKGTLFLDEIGEMSPTIQAKFLRVLEGHPFERLGGKDRVQVDVRVVAATNRDLEEMVDAGQFRRDLYFRLKVVEIAVPPLRRRPEDVETLSRHFLRRFAAEIGRHVRGFTPEAEAALRAHHWPGNVRELRNCIERAVVLAAAEWIDAPDLALSHLAAAGDTGRVPAGRTAGYAPESLDEVERRHVMATLGAVGGNKTKAAAILGIERSTLDRKLARWGQR
jgi:Nif-specific regulatory protein